MPKRKKPMGKHSAPHLPRSRNANPAGLVTDRPGHKTDQTLEVPFPLPFPLTQQLALIILVAITFIAYINAWSDSLTLDDRLFADSERFSGMALADMRQFFTEDLWAASGVKSSLYRPLLLVLIAFESYVFGDWFAGYHLVNIFLHVLATLLVYGFARHLLVAWGNQPSVSGYCALLAAAIFGVHPIHTEVVNSIFNGSEILVSIGVVGGLWWFLITQQNQPRKAWLGLSLIYFLVLLCRESGASLPALAVAVLWISSPDPWLQRLRKCLPVFLLVIPLAIYLALRANALAAPEEAISANVREQALSIDASAAPEEVILAGFANLAASMVVPAAAAAETSAEPISDSIIPNMEVAAEPIGEPSVPNVEIPVGPLSESAESDAEGQNEPISVLNDPALQQPPAQPDGSVSPDRSLSLQKLESKVSQSASKIWARPARILPAAGLWFESWKRLLWPHPLQIYYDEPVASPWLALVAQLGLFAAALFGYFKKQPGLLAGVTFFYLSILPSSRIVGDSNLAPGLADRILYLPSVSLAILVAVGLSLLVRRSSRRIAVFVVMMVVMIFIPLTWARNAEWASDTVLFERDYSRLENKQKILNTLLAAHLREENFSRVAELCDLHGETRYVNALIGAHCGSAYGNVGRFSDAEQAYLNATKLSDSRVFAHFNLAMMYTFLGRRAEAMEHFGLAIAAEPSDFMKEYFTALMIIQLYPNEREKLIEARQHLERALQLQPQHTPSRQELDDLNARLPQAMRTKPE